MTVFYTSNTITNERLNEKNAAVGASENSVKQPESNPQITSEELEIVESLFKYPSLEKVFDREDLTRLPVTKQKMQATLADLERVVRRGAKVDAARAATVIAAYQTALKFLDELETLRRT